MKKETKTVYENEMYYAYVLYVRNRSTKRYKKNTHKLVKQSKCQKLLNAARIAGVHNKFQRFTDDDLANKTKV